MLLRNKLHEAKPGDGVPLKQLYEEIVHEICPFDLGICPLFSCSFFWALAEWLCCFSTCKLFIPGVHINYMSRPMDRPGLTARIVATDKEKT